MDKIEKKERRASGMWGIVMTENQKPKKTKKKKHLAFDIVLEVFALFITTT